MSAGPLGNAGGRMIGMTVAAGIAGGGAWLAGSQAADVPQDLAQNHLLGAGGSAGLALVGTGTAVVGTAVSAGVGSTMGSKVIKESAEAGNHVPSKFGKAIGIALAGVAALAAGTVGFMGLDGAKAAVGLGD